MMKKEITLEDGDYDAMHDIILAVTGKTPNNEEIENYWNLMPEEIKGTAIQWGCNDTVFGDEMHEWLMEEFNPNKL